MPGPMIRVTTNAFEVKWERTRESSGEVVHYDVIKPSWDMKPRSDGTQDIGKAKGMELVMRLQQKVAPDVFNPEGAFDGKKNLYSAQRYNLGGSGAAKWVVPWDVAGNSRRPREVEITVTFVKVISMGTIEALVRHGSRNNLEDSTQTINMLNLFFQSGPRMKQVVGVYTAKSFFTEHGKRQIRGSVLEIWRGFFQSVRPTNGKLIVNVDVTQGIILPGQIPLNNVAMQCIEARNARDLQNLDERSLSKLRQFLVGIKVQVTLRGHSQRRPKVIKKVIRDVGSETFTKDGEEITVAEHFRRAHSVTIQRGELGVKLGSDGSFPLSKTNMPDLVRESMMFAPNNPANRLQAISSGWDALAYRESPFLRGAGISVNNRPMQVDGQFLDPPEIGFGKDSRSGQNVVARQQRSGQWDMMKKPLLLPGKVGNWVVVDFTNRNPESISIFVADLRQAMADRGIEISKVTSNTVMRVNPASGVRAALHHALNSTRPSAEFIIAILRDPDPYTYTEVKRFGDITHGIVTQCVRFSSKLEQNAMQRGGQINQYHNNLILKLNVKLGGLNWFPITAAMKALQATPTMILGADVSHPGPGSQLPSVASLVASMDPQLLRYAASVRIQSARTEMIADISEMLTGLLKMFWRANDRLLPRRIIMYRDGVSEGEFETVQRLEIQAMSAAMADAYGSDQNNWPAIVFIIVGKRHHFRFFPDHQQEDHKGNGNLPAGFVTSQGINHPLYRDFYLQSQSGLKGTSRPSHYTVLVNSLQLPLEKIQEMSFALCHCYARSTRSVKVPAPVYYADLVCRRAKFHFDEAVSGGSDGASVASSEDNVNLEFYQQHWNDINENLKNRMYFV